MRSLPSTRSGLRRGFTLIEMMVAVTITAILVILMTQITASFLDYWPKAEGQLKKNMDARMVLELMAQDLQAAVLHGQESPPTYEWLQWRYNTDPANPLPHTIYTTPVTGMLMFFTSPADRTLANPGNICAVAYRLAYQKPFGSTSSDKVFGLYRTMVEASPTFQNVLGQTDLYTGYWQSAPVLAQKDFLIANVLDFSVTFQMLQPDGSHFQLPARTALRLGPPSWSPRPFRRCKPRPNWRPSISPSRSPLPRDPNGSRKGTAISKACSNRRSIPLTGGWKFRIESGLALTSIRLAEKLTTIIII